MMNIFETFLPQLLRYPNPTDPLNGEAAALLMREPAAYESKVKGDRFSLSFNQRKEENSYKMMMMVEHTKRYATKEAVEATGDESEDEDDMSSIDSFSEEEAHDMEL